MPMHQDICCEDIIEAKADLATLKADVLKWRADHEHRQEQAYTMLSQQLVAVEGELNELRTTLANRLPGWATLVISLMSASIGVLVGVVFEVARLLAAHG